MSDIDNLNTFCSLVMKSKLSSRDEQLAKICERQRRWWKSGWDSHKRA